MSQPVPFTAITDRLDRLEAIVSSLRDDLAGAIERSREDFEDLNHEIENRFRYVYETMERADVRQIDGLRRLESNANTDLDRIRYDVSCLEGRCSNLERDRRY